MQDIVSKEFRKKFVDANIELLAAISWQESLTKSRGVLAISEPPKCAYYPYWLIPTEKNI